MRYERVMGSTAAWCNRDESTIAVHVTRLQSDFVCNSHFSFKAFVRFWVKNVITGLCLHNTVTNTRYCENDGC